MPMDDTAIPVAAFCTIWRKTHSPTPDRGEGYIQSKETYIMQGIKRMILGINLTIIGCALLISSTSRGSDIAIAICAIGLIFSVIGYFTPNDKAEKQDNGATVIGAPAPNRGE